MKALSKAEILNQYHVDSECDVTYKTDDGSHSVHYMNLKHINWKNAIKITVFFKTPKSYNSKGDIHTRKGAAYLIK